MASGYSGDFGEHVYETIDADFLVLDSTYRVIFKIESGPWNMLLSA